MDKNRPEYYKRLRELDNHPLIKTLRKRWDLTLATFQGIANTAACYPDKTYVSTYGMDSVGAAILEVKEWLMENDKAWFQQ